MHTHTYHQNDIHLIYAGGTFGSHGSPLSPLPAQKFLPILTDLLNTRLDSTQVVLSNDRIKDSSALNPNDFVYFYELICHAYQQGARRFVLITGTDTLSFLASFLANAFVDMGLSLVITGSMNPLLIADNPTYQINQDSDAWHNLSEAIIACRHHQGVFVQFYHQTFWAYNTQKIDSQHINAFHGLLISVSRPVMKPIHTKPITYIKECADITDIQSIFLLPNHASHIALQLANISHETAAVILIAFGAGNLPKTDEITAQLNRLHERNIPVVCTTMCAFNGVSSAYEAGSWQYSHHVWSGGNLSIAAIYGRLLWLALNNALQSSKW